MPPHAQSPTRPARSRVVALGAVLLLSLAACGGAQDTGTSAAAPAVGEVQQDGAAGGGVAGASSAAGAAPADAAAEQGSVTGNEAKAPAQTNVKAEQLARPRRIRTADVTMTVKNLDTASAAIRAAVEGAGGYISSETTAVSQPVESKQADGSVRSVQTGEGVVVARVPEPELDTTMRRIGGVGTVVSRNQTDQDVTGEIADVSSRVETAKASVARTRQLLAEAKSLQDIVFIEGQLTTREADLEALQARLKSLSDRADLSTLTVTLRLPDVVAVDTPEDTNSFLSGLKAGWEALVASTNVILTVLGAVLPVGVVLLVVGYPASVLLRRRTHRQQAEREAAAARWAAAQQAAQQTAQTVQPPAPAMAGAAAPSAAPAPDADPAP